MEEYNNEKYMLLENVENLFKRINRFGNEYNYCFDTFKPQSALGVPTNPSVLPLPTTG